MVERTPAHNHRRRYTEGVGFLHYFRVYRENPFSSATIEIAQNQTVVSTGPYAMVRHPMYFGGSLLFAGTPLALGSYWGLLAFGVAFPGLVAPGRREVPVSQTHGVRGVLPQGPREIDTGVVLA